VVGREGRTLRATWEASQEAYLGATVHGFPNLFVMVGPNTGLGHNSIVFMAESQAHHIAQALSSMEAAGATRLEVRPETQAAFNEDLQDKLSGSVWNDGGCQSWYLDANGKNSTLWPGFTFTYWAATRKLDQGAFALSKLGSTVSAGKKAA
jgi:hypothetical protein